MLGRGNPAAAAIILDEAFALAQEHGVRIFVPVTLAIAAWRIWNKDASRKRERSLPAHVEEAKSVGYKSIELRASIYLARHAQPARTAAPCPGYVA